MFKILRKINPFMLSTVLLFYVFMVLYIVKKDTDNAEKRDKCYIWLEYDENNGRIIIHFKGKKYKFLRFQTESQNEKVFRYLYDHERKLINKNELNSKQDILISEPLSSFIPKMGFKGQLKKMFFRISKSTVYFRKEVLLKEVEKLHPDFIRLITEIQKLEEIK